MFSVVCVGGVGVCCGSAFCFDVYCCYWAIWLCVFGVCSFVVVVGVCVGTCGFYLVFRGLFEYFSVFLCMLFFVCTDRFRLLFFLVCGFIVAWAMD